MPKWSNFWNQNVWTWREYEEVCWKRWRAEAEKQNTQTKAQFEAAHPVKTHRDDYGWRSLPGTSYLWSNVVPITKRK